jgi:hypothetical protein
MVDDLRIIPGSDSLLDHRPTMGSCIWEYLWLVAHVTAAAPDGNGHSVGIVDHANRFPPVELLPPSSDPEKRPLSTWRSLRPATTSSGRLTLGTRITSGCVFSSTNLRSEGALCHSGQRLWIRSDSAHRRQISGRSLAASLLFPGFFWGCSIEGGSLFVTNKVSLPTPMSVQGYIWRCLRWEHDTREHR